MEVEGDGLAEADNDRGKAVGASSSRVEVVRRASIRGKGRAGGGQGEGDRD